MRYGITDLAEMLGITTSAIRYFEKEQLIWSRKDRSGRRNYDEEDVFRLLSYTKYRSMDIPMKEIVHQFSGRENDWKSILDREQAAKERVLEKAEYYRMLAGFIDEHIRHISLIGPLLDRYEFNKSPAMILMQDKECGWLSSDRSSQRIVRQWVDHMPEVQLAVVHDAAVPFGYMISAESETRKQLPMKLNVEMIESASCLHTVVKAPEDFAYHPDKAFDKPMQYALSRGLKPEGRAWGQILLVEVEEGQRLHTYVELWIPVC